jgi:biopolymer transport protein ExbD
MQKVNRLILVSLLTAATTGGVWAMEDAKEAPQPAEYKRSDPNCYSKGSVVKVHPSAVIIAEGSCTKNGDSYFFTPHKKAPRAIYIEALNDWIEPITPPDMPASLGIAPDAMQIREPQGDVEAAFPSAPSNFLPVTNGMILPDGTVVKTGADGTAAVLFGGVDSARLMPNSAAAMQQNVTAQSRSVEVDLTAGGVFSKVGTQVGVASDYEVHTPAGNAIAKGGDFVTLNYVAQISHTDVWVAQGKVELDRADGTKVGQVSSNGTGPLHVLRTVSGPAASSLELDAQELTEIFNFIPLANQKIKALRDRMAGGGTLTANEQAYLNRIKQVPCLIKLALVEPPAPVPAAPVATSPAVPMVPIEINLRPDGMVDLMGQTMDLNELKSRLTAIAKTNPSQPLAITGRDKVTHDQFAKVRAIYKALKLKVTVPLPPPPTPPNTPMSEPVIMAPALNAPAPVEPPATNLPTPVLVLTPTIPPAPPANPPPAPLKPKPMRAVVRVDGKINFQGATYELPGFKLKLEALMKAKPDQAILLKAGKTVPYENFEAVLVTCQSIPVKNLTVLSAATPEFGAPAATESPATNLPTPGLLMNPSMEPMSNPPPETPSAPPTTNAPPPAGP